MLQAFAACGCPALDSPETRDGRGFHQFTVLSKLSFIDKVSIHTDPRQVAVTLVCSALLRGGYGKCH